MASSFNTFRLPPTHLHSQFIPYNAPAKAKPPSRRYPPKNASSSADEWHDMDEILAIGLGSNTKPKDRGVLAPTSRRAEVVDLTCLDSEVNCEIGGVGAGGSGVSSDDDLSTQNERESVGLEQSVSMRTSLEDTRDESSNQPARSEGTSQENAVVIEDSQPESDTDTDGENCPQEDDIGAQVDDSLEVSGISTPECHGRKCPTGMEAPIYSEAVEGPEPRASGLPRRELMPTQPTVDHSLSRSSCDGKEKKAMRFADRSLMTDIERSTQEAGGHTVLQATTHQPQRPMQMKAKRQGKFPTLENTSSSSGGTDGDDYDSDNNPTRKRKRSPPAKRHCPMSNTTSKQRPKHAAHSARQRKPSPFRGRPLSSRPSAPKPLSAAQYSGYDINIFYSDDSSDDSSEENADHGLHLGSNKQPKSTPRPHRSHRQKQKRNRGRADDDEYEVERILEARVYHRKLQYRAKWLGYEDDPEWYDASNFKNSPHKLRDFHRANPTRPGPPKRLGGWVQCWEEDRDADDHPDDNKPERSHRGGGTP